MTWELQFFGIKKPLDRLGNKMYYQLMTMHLVNPGLSLINTKKSKKKPNPAQLRARAEHDAWLRKHGVHPDQLQSRPRQTNKLKLNLVVDKTGPQVSNGFANAGMKRSIWDSEWQKTYEDDPLMAEREAEALRKAEALKADLHPLYNKGPIMLKPRGLSMTDLGKRR